jgi:hypothetical protein
MPLLDHFHPPLSLERRWESFHAAWSGSLADALNRILPAGYFAEEQTHAGAGVEIDIFEVQVFNTDAGPRLVAAIELVSPRNKDRPEARQAFAVKCASYLHQGISLIVIDIVTERRANLHQEGMRLLSSAPSPPVPADVALYAVAYRPVRRGEREEIDLWPEPLALAARLPVLPLALNAEICLPVDLEATYVDACRRRRLV